MENNIFYEDLVSTIVSILKDKKLDHKLLPFNYEEDKKILHNFFIKPILELNNNNLNINWDNEKWIESMKHIRLGLLSFLYKNNATLYKIYFLVKNDKIKSHILLEKYKNLINNFITVEKMTKANKFLLEENILLDELQNKNYFLFLNLKNITDPRYLSYIFDLISHKEYRKNILKHLVEGTEKIDLKNIIDIQEETSYEFIESFLKNMNENNIYNKVIYYIMTLNFNGEILMKKDAYNKLQIYINDVIKNSSQLDQFLKNLNDEYKSQENRPKFKNEIRIVYLPEHIVLTKKKNMKQSDIEIYKEYYNKTKHIDFTKIYFDKFYKEIFVENKKFYFSKNDIIQRIIDLISLAIEYISLNYFETKEEKIDRLNKIFTTENVINNTVLKNDSFLKKFDIDTDNQSDIIEIIKNIKENGLIESTGVSEESYENKEILKCLIFQIKENLKKNENADHFHAIIAEFIYILKNIDLVDISTLEKSDFTICYDFVSKLTSDVSKLKNFFFHIVEKENFALILSFIEKKNILKINKILKEKIVEIFLKTVLEIVNIIKIEDGEKTKSFIKFLCIVAKGIDYAIFYLKKFKKNKNNMINQKKNVIKQVIYK